MTKLLIDSINGEFNYEKRKPFWVDREMFNRLKDKNGYIQQCWSFGNNGKDYLFSKNIEPYKRSMHNAIILNEFDVLAINTLGIDSFPIDLSIKDRRLFLRKKIEGYKINGIPVSLKRFLSKEQFQQIEQLNELQQLQQLKQIERLQRLQRLEDIQSINNNYSITSLHYKDMKFKPNSVIYCDPPYEGTRGYKKSNFNKKEFLDWANSQNNLVLISEYNIDDPRFYLIGEIKTKTMMCSTDNSINRIERVYSNRKIRYCKEDQLSLF